MVIVVVGAGSGLGWQLFYNVKKENMDINH